MIIKEFNFLLKNTQTSETIKNALLIKLNAKCSNDIGYIANVYDTTGKKLYLLVSDNVKMLHSLNNNIFEVGNGSNSENIPSLDIDVSIFATKEELARVQAGDVDLTGYLTENKANKVYVLKSDVYSKTEIDNKLKSIPKSPISGLDNASLSLITDIQDELDNFRIINDFLKATDIELKDAIDIVYKILYKKILELELEIKNLKNSTNESKTFTDKDVPELEAEIFSKNKETEEEKKAQQVFEDGDVSLSDRTETTFDDEDEVLIFD